MDWLDLLAVQGTLSRVFSNTTVQKHQFFTTGTKDVSEFSSAVLSWWAKGRLIPDTASASQDGQRVSRTLEALSLDRGASHGEYQAHVDAPGGRWARAALGRMRGGWVLGGREEDRSRDGQELWVEGSCVGVLGRRGLGARVWCQVDLVG